MYRLSNFKVDLFQIYLFSVYHIKRNIKVNHFDYVLKKNMTWWKRWVMCSSNPNKRLCFTKWNLILKKSWGVHLPSYSTAAPATLLMTSLINNGIRLSCFPHYFKMFFTNLDWFKMITYGCTMPLIALSHKSCTHWHTTIPKRGCNSSSFPHHSCPPILTHLNYFSTQILFKASTTNKRKNVL